MFQSIDAANVCATRLRVAYKEGTISDEEYRMKCIYIYLQVSKLMKQQENNNIRRSLSNKKVKKSILARVVSA